MKTHDHAAQLAMALRGAAECLQVAVEHWERRDGKTTAFEREIIRQSQAALAAWDKHNAPAPKQEALL